MYAGDDPVKDGIYMIHPEFLDANGNVVGEEIPLMLEDKATMWILVEEMKEKVHRSRIKLGTKGYFMEGSRKIGEVEVDSIVGLNESYA